MTSIEGDNGKFSVGTERPFEGCYGVWEDAWEGASVIGTSDSGPGVQGTSSRHVGVIGVFGATA